MSKTIPILIVAAIAILGVGILFFYEGEQEMPELRIYNWTGYMSDEVLRDFEAKFNCSVVCEYFSSNEEMLAKLKQKSGLPEYDIIFPSEYAVNVLRNLKMLQPLDHAKLPNLKHLDPEYLKLIADREMKYSVPYMVSVTGIGYNPEAAPDFKPSWGIFAAASHQGRVAMLDDMREALGAALKFQGRSLNTVDEAEIAQARELLLDWKKNVVQFDVEESTNCLVDEKADISQCYLGDFLQSTKDAKQFKFVVPEEGTSLSIECMVVPVGARNPRLALEFINFVHLPENCAKIMREIYYPSPNLEAVKLLPDEMRNDKTMFMNKELLAKSEIIRDLGVDNAKYVRAWEAVKAAK